MVSRTYFALGAVIITLLLTPLSSAGSSGMNYLDSTTTENSDAYTSSVSVNHNNTIIASSHGRFVEFHDGASLNLIKRFDLGREVYDIQFSPDGGRLAISIAALESVPDSLRIINAISLEFESGQARGNNRPGNIDWSPDGQRIVAPNLNNGALVYNASSMAEILALNGRHTSDVTCVSFSKTGNYIATGDESGKIQLWDSSGNALEADINVGEEVVGCDFSLQDAKIAISTISGNVFSFVPSGSSLQSIDLGNNYGIQWSENSDLLYVLESDNSPELIALDGSTFTVIHSTKLMHKSLDFTVIEDSTLLSNFYVATDSNHIAIYGNPSYPEGYGDMGSDLDGDNIPDVIDLDDDGDSYLDDWDFNCQNATVCSREPDLQTIRSMRVGIEGNSLIIEDIYTMSQSDTYIFRNLTRRAIISDQRISYEETNMIESAFCHNMDQNDYIQKLRNSISLSVGQVNNGTTNCEILDGLSFTKTFDKEQLTFSFKTEFDVAPNISLPLTIYFDSQISVIESSITHKVENYPILIEHITLEDESLYTLWWKSDTEKPQLNYTSLVERDSQINTALESIKDNIWLILAVAASSLLVAWVLIRRRNLNSVILDDSEFEKELAEDSDIGYDDNFIADDDISKPTPISKLEQPITDNNDDVIVSEAIPSEERPTDRRAFILDEDTELSESRNTKRRSGRIQRNAQGPIMTTKRKRLDGKLDVPGEKIISKKSPLGTREKNVPKVRKVRRVKATKKEDY